MSGPGRLDRPGAPTSPGAWDDRSEEWLAAETDVREDRVAGRPTTAADDPPATRTAGDGRPGPGESADAPSP